MKNEKENDSIENLQLQFPKKLKVSVSAPLITLLVFIMTIAVLAGVCKLVFPGLIFDYGNLRLGREPDNYEQMIEQYEETLEEYKNILDDYKHELENLKAADSHDSNEDSTNFDTAVTNEDKPELTENKSKDKFYIYCPENLQEYDVAKCLGIGSDKSVVFDYYKAEEAMKLDALLEMDEDSEEYPDLIMTEVSLLKDIDSSYFCTSDDLDVASDTMDSMYPFGLKLAENSEGDIDKFPYVVTPGYIQLRADMAELYLGTNDPEKLYNKYFCDMESLAKACNTVFRKSHGKVSLFAGYDDVEKLYDGQLQKPDITLAEFKELTDGSFPEYDLYSADWMDSVMENNTRDIVMGVVSAPWISEYILDGSFFADTNSVFVKAPVAFDNGSVCFVVPIASGDKDKASKIIANSIGTEDSELAHIEIYKQFFNNTNIDIEEAISEKIEDSLLKQDATEFYTNLLNME